MKKMIEVFQTEDITEAWDFFGKKLRENNHLLSSDDLLSLKEKTNPLSRLKGSDLDFAIFDLLQIDNDMENLTKKMGFQIIIWG